MGEASASCFSFFFVHCPHVSWAVNFCSHEPIRLSVEDQHNCTGHILRPGAPQEDLRLFRLSGVREEKKEGLRGDGAERRENGCTPTSSSGGGVAPVVEER